MKTPLIVFCAWLAFRTPACGQSPDVERRLAELEKRVTALEKASPASLLVASSPSPAVETKSPLELVSWDYHFGRGDYSQYHYAITVSLKNNAAMDIKLIEGSLQFTDLLGTRVYGIKITPDLHIPAGKVVTDKGQYPVNQFIAEQARMAQMKKEDIKATLVILKLVFADNSMAEYTP